MKKLILLNNCRLVLYLFKNELIGMDRMDPLSTMHINGR